MRKPRFASTGEEFPGGFPGMVMPPPVIHNNPPIPPVHGNIGLPNPANHLTGTMSSSTGNPSTEVPFQFQHQHSSPNLGSYALQQQQNQMTNSKGGYLTNGQNPKNYVMKFGDGGKPIVQRKRSNSMPNVSEAFPTPGMYPGIDPDNSNPANAQSFAPMIPVMQSFMPNPALYPGNIMFYQPQLIGGVGVGMGFPVGNMGVSGGGVGVASGVGVAGIGTGQGGGRPRRIEPKPMTTPQVQPAKTYQFIPETGQKPSKHK